MRVTLPNIAPAVAAAWFLSLALVVGRRGGQPVRQRPRLDNLADQSAVLGPLGRFAGDQRPQRDTDRSGDHRP